uniref:Inositol3 putative n=1 Tax=Albugo laibachii Nc14 TaxID=890382 RepID=F0WIP8_9STRA|nr:inositol3 putative [Albugo laibachii Nc14]|eukprot:CCA21139.1 inositol3 putative [Albugo laibachii Nc14]
MDIRRVACIPRSLTKTSLDSGTLARIQTLEDVQEMQIEPEAIDSLIYTPIPYRRMNPIHSSLLWIESGQNRMTISVSLSTAILVDEFNHTDPLEVCVDLEPSQCLYKGRNASVSILNPSTATAVFIWDRNPFSQFKASFASLDNMNELTLSIDSTNSTYFCITNFIPHLFFKKSQYTPSFTWRNAADYDLFSFQIQLHGIQVVSKEKASMNHQHQRRQRPALGYIEIRDQDRVLGLDCSQVLMHRRVSLRHGLSVFSVMSIVIYAIVLAGAILITRMNGISFSIQTFFNDVTAISIILMFALGIIANALWISESSKVQMKSSSTHLYFLLTQIEVCIKWTMMTSVCFHWADIVLATVPRKKIILGFLVVNCLFYSGGISMIINFTTFFKCTYNDYLYNPSYDKSMCGLDYCPDLQPLQWKYAVTHVCHDVPYSNWFFPALWSQMLLIFITTLGLLILGVHIVQRGFRILYCQHGDFYQRYTTQEQHVNLTKVMKNSLVKFVIVLAAIWLTSSIGVSISLSLYFFEIQIPAVPWYFFVIWMPMIVPPCALLLLQWNSRLQHLSWKESNDGHFQAMNSVNRRRNSTDLKRNSLSLNSGEAGFAKSFVGGLQEETKETETTKYENVRQSILSMEGSQNVLTIALQLMLPNLMYRKGKKPSRCFVELYAGGMQKAEENEKVEKNDSTSNRFLPQTSSISTLVQTSLQHGKWGIKPPTSCFGFGPQGDHFSRTSNFATHQFRGRACSNAHSWKRVGITETVVPSLEDDSSSCLQASFSSVLQLPLTEEGNVELRFLVYELIRETDSDQGDTCSQEGRTSLHRSSYSLTASDERKTRIGGSIPSPSYSLPYEASSNCNDSNWAQKSSIVVSQPSKKNILYEFSCLQTDLIDFKSKNLCLFPSKEVCDSRHQRIEAAQLRVKSMIVSVRPLPDLKTFYASKCFQFTSTKEFVVEDLLESVLTSEIPMQFLNCLCQERTKDLEMVQEDLQNYIERCRKEVVSNFYDNVIEQIQDENDQFVIQTWLEERVKKRMAYVELLRQCYQVCVDRARKGEYFKPSTEKRNALFQFLPTNLHVQDMWVGPMEQLRSQKSRRLSTQVNSYSTITVGAFAAHSLQFRHGIGILGLEGKLNKMTSGLLNSISIPSPQNLPSGFPTSSSSSQRHITPVLDVDWRQPERQQQDELNWQIITRMDICFSQAITTCVASFCRLLVLSMQKQEQYPLQSSLWSQIGFLLHVESLLSTHGKEIGILQDFAAAVDMLKHVGFQLEIIDPSLFPIPSICNVQQPENVSIVGVHLQSTSKIQSSTGLKYVVLVRIGLDSLALSTLPQDLIEGKVIRVIPVIFTQGISEIQTLANNTSLRKTLVQNTINQKSLIELNAYVEQYKSVVTLQCATRMKARLALVRSLQFELEARIVQTTKRVVRAKDPKILQLSARLCRLLGAGRVTASKNATDRAAMSVTLEQGHILMHHHNLAKQEVTRVVSTMRSNGVRLVNVMKNTQKFNYAFNSLQRSILPEEYRCPEGTYG